MIERHLYVEWPITVGNSDDRNWTITDLVNLDVIGRSRYIATI